jgi:hypothetical protein
MIFWGVHRKMMWPLLALDTYRPSPTVHDGIDSCVWRWKMAVCFCVDFSADVRAKKGVEQGQSQSNAEKAVAA